MNISTIARVCEQKWADAQDMDDQPEAARRLFHGRGHLYEGCEHVVVNWYPPYLHIGVYAHASRLELTGLWQALSGLNSQIEGIAIQQRDGRKTVTEVVYGQVPDEHLVYEAGLAYWIMPKRNQNVGLFMDMAHVRAHLAKNMVNARVLNLFAYTCAFSVAAIGAGAQHVVNNDMSKNALGIGERNHLANGQDLRKVSMLGHNVFKSWWKIRQLGPYDVVIIDPPTNQRGSFVAEKSYGQILKRIAEFTQPGGQVIACLNSPFLGPEFITQQMQRWCPDCRLVDWLPPHEDFPDKYPERGLKVAEFRYR